MSFGWRFACVPAALAAAWAANEAAGVYTKIYTVCKYIAHRHGYRVQQYPKDDPVAVWSPRAAALVSGGIIYWLSRKAIDPILISTAPNRERLFDRLNPADRSRGKLTLRRLWELAGPVTATRASWRELGRVHGFTMLSAALSLGWAICISPYVQAKVETVFFTPKGETLVDVSRPLTSRGDQSGSQTGSSPQRSGGDARGGNLR